LPVVDITRPFYGLEVLPYLPHTHPPRLALEEVAYHLLWRYRANILGDSTNRSQAERSGVEAYVRLIKRLEAEGAQVFVEVLPSRSAGMGVEFDLGCSEQYYLEMLRRAAEPTGAMVGFPFGLFQGKGKSRDIYHDQCHLYRLGHRYYAQYLKDRLLQNSPLLGKWVVGHTIPPFTKP
jgi:hypothetical protein